MPVSTIKSITHKNDQDFVSSISPMSLTSGANSYFCIPVRHSLTYLIKENFVRGRTN